MLCKVHRGPFSLGIYTLRLLFILWWNHKCNFLKDYRKLTKLITWITALSNSMKLWAMPCRATQDGLVMVGSSDKMWSTGRGNGKPLQYSCLENPMNSMRRQKRYETERWTSQVGWASLVAWLVKNLPTMQAWKWSRSVVSDSATPRTVAC